MKTRLTIALLFLLLFTISVAAQTTTTTSDPTDLTVLEKSWHKDFISPNRDGNPLRPNEDLIMQTRAEKTEIRDRDYRLPSTTEPRMPAMAPRPIPPGRPKDIYIYKIKVKNTGVKDIKTVDWEYQFLHPDTQEVLGSRHIVSRVKLGAGKTQDVEVRLIQKPTLIVSADQLDKKYRDQFQERVIIHRIVYRDGSVWRRQP
jgi:hypothetical protein